MDVQSVLLAAGQLQRRLVQRIPETRLFGGVAVEMLAPWERVLGISRPLKDVDIIVPRASADVLIDVVAGEGWQVDRRSVMFNESRRIRAISTESGLVLDAYTDPLHLNQKIILGGRLMLPGSALNVADLLATKLQAAEPTPLDLLDIIAIVSSMPISQSDADGSLNVNRLQNWWQSSWRRWYASRLNLELASELLESETKLSREVKRLARPPLTALRSVLESVSGGSLWRVRRAIGPRLRWYDEID